jgi:Domain of unknown function (DUF4760)
MEAEAMRGCEAIGSQAVERRRTISMVQPTYDDANLLLRLYEIRREDKMRQARQWFLFEFEAGDWSQIRETFFTGVDQDNYLRMVVSYWDMACALVKQGVLNKDLFYTTSGEHLAVWNKTKPWVAGVREEFKDPLMLRNLEEIAEDTIQWRARQLEKFQ